MCLPSSAVLLKVTLLRILLRSSSKCEEGDEIQAKSTKEGERGKRTERKIKSK